MKKILFFAIAVILAVAFDYCSYIEAINKFGSVGDFFTKNPFSDVAVFYLVFLNVIFVLLGWLFSEVSES